MASVAHQIGVLVAIERNRKEWTQEQLAAKCGLHQTRISKVENGDPLPKTNTNKEIEDLFKVVGLDADPKLANFVMWWRDNH